jgi:diguanylate cyclase (GGDEF)-like protein
MVRSTADLPAVISHVAASCATPETAAPDVCQPRVRRRLLVVGRERPTDPGADVVTLAAGRIGTRLEMVADEAGAMEYLARNQVSCLVLDATRAGSDPLAAVTRLTAAHAEVPLVVIGADAEPTVAVAVVQGGAQDYLVEEGLDPAALERAIRHGIDRHRTRMELRHLALHDHLTGVANRALFADRLTQALKRSARTSAGIAVLFVDIDGFKRINDNLGHSGGDEALRASANRLRDAIRPADTLARFGGDEFTVLCEDVPDVEAALAIAGRVVEAIGAPLRIAGAEVVLRASVGVAVDFSGDVSGDQLLRDSDAAMYQAKHRGGARAELFVPDGRAGGNTLALEAELRRAIPHQLRLAYQPQVRLSDGGIVGAEALLRWHHPERGVVSPAEFIPVAEESGLIVPMGRWVLAEACGEAVRLGREGGGPLQVSVNVSGRQVVDPGLVGDVEAALVASGLDPRLLQLELTESILIQNLDEGVSLIHALKELGVTVALDDFGTGYSSLSYLKRLPVDTVKIDRSFVSGLPDCREDVAIVSAVVSFARALEIEVVAEGVETEVHVEALRRLGCERVQGFHFHRPLDPTQLLERLAAAR